MLARKKVPQLRIAVNSLCGRSCLYCRPSGEAIPTRATAKLSSDLVVLVCTAVRTLGVDQVKITGGEPALWEPLVNCVSRLKAEVRVEQLDVISRHPRIGVLAPALAAAGVDLINISLDTLNPQRHKQITGKEDLEDLIDALRRCVATGVPCKVNMVVMVGINDAEIEPMIEFCERNGIRSLKLLDLIQDLEDGEETNSDRLAQLHGLKLRDVFMPLDRVVEDLRARSKTVQSLFQGGLGHPMTALTLESGLEVIVKDHQTGAWYGSVCKGCKHYPCHDALMALRLTADARLQFCLLREDIAIGLEPHLGASSGTLNATLAQAIQVYEKAVFMANTP